MTVSNQAHKTAVVNSLNPSNAAKVKTQKLKKSKKLTGVITFAVLCGKYLILRVNTKWLYVKRLPNHKENPIWFIGQSISCKAYTKTVKNREVHFLLGPVHLKPAASGWENLARKVLRASGFRKLSNAKNLTPQKLWDLFWHDRLDLHTLIGIFHALGFPLNRDICPAAVVYFGTELYKKNRHHRVDLLIRAVRMFLHLISKQVSSLEIQTAFSSPKVQEKIVFTDGKFYPVDIYYKKEAVIKKIKSSTCESAVACAYTDLLDALKNNKYVVVTGSAGVGKTTLIKNLSLKIFKAGTTGKASQKFGANLTLHKLLNYDGVCFRGISQDWIDCLAIDECSMLTWDTLYELICGKSSKRIGKVIFIGDPEQLPPPDGEPAFVQIVNMLPKIVLTQKHRGQMAVKEVSFNDIHSMLNAVKTIIFKSIKEKKTWQVMCPVYQAYPGVDMINEFLEKVIPPAHKKVIVTRNVYSDNALTAVNGTTGFIVNRHPNGFVTLKTEDNQIHVVSEKVLHPACCLSVHKAQGSEWDVCILVIPKNYQPDPETFKTGTTRGKEITYVFKIF